MKSVKYLVLFLVLVSTQNTVFADTTKSTKRSTTITNKEGLQLRLTAYGSQIIRAQYALPNETFLPDDYYEMVETHQWDGQLKVKKKKGFYEVRVVGNQSLLILVNKKTLQIDFQKNGVSQLKQNRGFYTNKDELWVDFKYDENEHFTGLGHSYFGRAKKIDLRGQKHQRNYGSHHGEQAPLIVPFYMSSKNYGIFLNSTFENVFNFGESGNYQIGLKTSGYKAQMDYFFINGTNLKEVLSNYVKLTGKPRLPQKSIFGLQLSDKGHDHNSETPSDEKWWKEYIKTHKDAGYPIDHVVNDNRWRAGGGKRCESRIEWDKGRYPNPSEYKEWLDKEGLTITLDFNRCIGQFSEGWKKEFNIPVTDSIDFKESAPDLTNPDFRKWFWDIFYKKAFNPDLNFSGDGLWIDEFDEMGNAPKDMLLSNGRSSAEMRNYWFYLIAKALVKDGWDKQIGEQKRPYVWVRGMTAGAQRYATLWSGDIQPSFEDMRLQIRGMQLAGLSGFPFWGHDAGGFFDWEKSKGPDEDLYQKWSMGMGIFSPIWKPHGMGQSRWPLDRVFESKVVAKKYADLRYSLMPYTYTIAHQAHASGVPMARAMLLEYAENTKAWKYDLQYLWGSSLLVAPMHSANNRVEVWLPKGGWYNFWNETFYDQEMEFIYETRTKEYPVFVKSGAIIPMVKPATGVSKLSDKDLIIHVYTGNDGYFELYEDDGITEKFRTQKEKRITPITYLDNNQLVQIQAAQGNYANAPQQRSYTFVFHGMDNVKQVVINGNESQNTTYDEGTKTQTIFLGAFGVEEELIIELRY